MRTVNKLWQSVITGGVQMIRNRKGDIPTTSLLFIAVFLIILAWMNFLSSGKSHTNISNNVSIALSEIEFSQQYIINEASLIAGQTIALRADDLQLKSKFMEIAATHVLGIEQEGNLFAKIRNGNFSFVREGDNYSLQINAAGVEARNSILQIKRSFDVNIKFDKNGQRLA